MFTTRNLLMLVLRHTLIASGVIAVALVVVIFLANQITHLTENVLRNRQLASTLEARTELFSNLKRDTTIVGTNDTVISNAFVPSDNILDFISSLESIALKNGVTQTFRFETPATARIDAPFTIESIAYANTLNTNTLTFSNYLKEFERLPYFTKIDSFTISSQDKTGIRNASTASIRATLYTKTTQ